MRKAGIFHFAFLKLILLCVGEETTEAVQPDSLRLLLLLPEAIAAGSTKKQARQSGDAVAGSTPKR